MQPNSVVFLALLLFHIVGGNSIYYLIPSPTTQCPVGESCFTLSMLATSTNSHIDSNTTLIFLAGSHTLDLHLSVSGNIFLALSASSSNTTIITCEKNATLKFVNIAQIQIKNLNFIRCHSLVQFVDHLILEDSSFHGTVAVGSVLNLIDTNTNINRCSFHFNTIGTQKLLLISSSFSAWVGGALTVSGSNVDIDNSRFIGNSAQLGGAIFLELYSNLTIHESTFSNNSATLCSGDQCYGGALFVDNSCTIIAYNSTFINNTSEYVGGAIALFQATYIDSQSTFAYNEADSYGGAIYAFDSSRIAVDGGHYNSNRVGSKGGVMFAYKYGSIIVDNCFFNNNMAGTDAGVMYAEYRSSITVKVSTFNNNQAGNKIGVMCAYNNSGITVDSSFFENNYAISHVGVIYAQDNSTIIVHNGIFNNNTAGEEGGALFAQNFSSVIVYDSSFDNNKAGDDGGALYAIENSTITVYNSLFDNNEAVDVGGAVFARGNSKITVESSSFNSNSAQYSAGALVAYLESSITVRNCSFYDNKAASVGGVMIAIPDSTITVNNCSFSNNKASDAGVLYAQRNSTIFVHSSSFNNNLADNDGGVLIAYISSSIKVNNCSFNNDTARNSGGVAFVVQNSSITINQSSFDNNKADLDGGVAYVFDRSRIILENKCTFIENTASEGGVVALNKASIRDLGSIFSNNMVSVYRGVFALIEGDVYVKASNFTNNTARQSGGVLCTLSHELEDNVTLEKSNFLNNTAHSGGVIASLTSQTLLKAVENKFSFNNALQGGALYLETGATLIIRHSHFSNNSANGDGGVIYSFEQNSVMIANSTLKFNTAKINGGVLHSVSQDAVTIAGDHCTFGGNQASSGGVLYAVDSEVHVQSQMLLMVNNVATNMGGVFYLSRTDFFFDSGNITFARNRGEHGGALFASGSRISCTNQSLLMINNIATENGGGMYLSKSYLALLNDINEFKENQADNGGTIYATQSTILIEAQSLTEMNSNVAIHNGGALYLIMSNLQVGGDTTYITRNRAYKTGGGLHAANSTLVIDGKLQCVSNEAINGGGFGLEKSSKVYGGSLESNSINFVSNRTSHYGGALYVHDETNPDMCVADSTWNTTWTTECFLDAVYINTLDNSAGISGSNLFGGLLDRCTVHSESHEEIKGITPVGLANFQRLSNVSLDTISSHPVRMCFCQDGQPNCNYQPGSIQVDREMTFSVEIVAYDQANHMVDAIIDSSVNSSAGGLGENQAIQHISEACTKLNFNLFSPLNTEILMLIMRGPCNHTEVSRTSISIEIKCTCPIGFEVFNNDERACICVCNQILQPYDKTECNVTTKSIIRRDNFWITYINHTDPESRGYLIYPYCPFDYCHLPEKQVSVNLNLPDGSNTQCTSHRSRTLCGSCEAGYSVSLGSSRCLQCPTYWPALLVTIIIVFILSGIGLVILLLVLNLTVAIGTLNAIVFYANIMAATKSTFFSSSEVSFTSVLISWLNFDIGINTCFFDGMDTYTKTWLQLAFPTYIVFIVIVIIQLSYHFDAFGRLLGKRDPVATLATLILLSYTKLLQTVITAFSYATLNYPNGSREYVWLSDATIRYFTGKHGMLLIAAVAILLIGLVYTFLLFSWQWLLCCPSVRIKFIKLVSFLELYHVPYQPNHRYWTGLLLLVRVSVYLVSAFNPSGDPKITLLSTAFIMSCLLVYIAAFDVSIYKTRFIKVMESFTYFNIITLSIFTWYNLNTATNQNIVTNISVGITFIQLLGVISFHIYRHANRKLFSRIQETVFCQKMNANLQPITRYHLRQLPINNDIHQGHELLDIDDRATYTNTNTNIACELTYSIVEIPKLDHDESIPPSPKIETVSETQRAIDSKANVNASLKEDRYEGKKLQLEVQSETKPIIIVGGSDGVTKNLGSGMETNISCEINPIALNREITINSPGTE